MIKEHQLAVPIYQRPYAWEKKHIDDMFNDIHNAISNNENEYFLGTIVFSEKENSDELEIVDGQQRITSIYIFLSAVEQFFRQRSEDEQANSIQQDFLSIFNRRTGEHLPKIKLGNLDNIFFREYIVNKNEATLSTKESHERIKNTKQLSIQKINKLAELSDANLNILHDWIEFISDKLKVVTITVPSKANAFTICETLNDRGLELAQVDLLKNYLYSKASDRIEEIQNTWIEMTSQIETAENESLILRYIKHYWSAQNGLTREKNRELYNDIKSQIRNTTQSITFVNNLKNDTSLYLAIVNHNHQYWNDFDPKVKQYIETLNFFNLEQYRPLLLSILKKFTNKQEIRKSLKLIVSWLVRNLITGSLGGGTLEVEYAKKAKDIAEGKINNATDLKTALQHIIPSDSEFKDKFIYAKSSTEKYARYYLRAIENHKRGGIDDPELLVNSDPSAVNLEHILPKNPSENWPNFSEEELNEYKNRIGNLTLMQSRPNSEEGNAPFTDKKSRYQSSDLWITKMINDDYNEWSAESIKNRQEKLAEIAMNVWNLTIS